MNIKSKFVILALVSISFISCTSNRVIRDKSKIAYSKNNYEKAISYLHEENKEQSLIDLNLDEAMLLTLNGQYKESSTLFNQTGYDMALYTGEMSVGQMLQAALTSEESVTYVGPAYEYSMIDIMNAFNYMKMGDYDNARAMMRRSFNNNKSAFNSLKEKLREINRQSENAFNSSYTQDAISDMANEGYYYDFNSFVNTNLNNKDTDYGLSPFIFFLGASLFANDGDQALAYEWIDNIRPFISNDLFRSVVGIPRGMGSINVVALSDTIVKREEMIQYVPMIVDLYGLHVNFKLSWPYVPESYNVVNNIKVRVFDQYTDSNGKIKLGQIVDSGSCELIEDFDDAVRLDVASKAEGALSRSFIRNITRKTASYIAGIIAVEAAKELADEGGMLEFLAYLGTISALQLTMDALDSSEHADIRQCAFFPSKATASGFIVEPGVYTVEINYLDKRGDIVKREYVTDVLVEEGKTAVVPSEYINTGNIRISDTKQEENYYY